MIIFQLELKIQIIVISFQDVARIVRHHQLKVVSVDINLETLEPQLSLMERLITQKTVAILVAHLCGRWVNMEPIIDLAMRYQLCVIEDCAESFCGFVRTGHPQSDLSLFSFGVIKFSTSFGGGIAKIKHDKDFKAMNDMYEKYPEQNASIYLKKVLKYVLMYNILQVWPWPELNQLCRRTGVKDWKDVFVKYLRGFPNDLIPNIRCRPSTAMLSVMVYKHLSFKQSDFDLQRVKGDYFLSKLNSAFRVIGTNVKVNNYWLFPVIVVSF